MRRLKFRISIAYAPPPGQSPCISAFPREGDYPRSHARRNSFPTADTDETLRTQPLAFNQILRNLIALEAFHSMLILTHADGLTLATVRKGNQHILDQTKCSRPGFEGHLRIQPMKTPMLQIPGHLPLCSLVHFCSASFVTDNVTPRHDKFRPTNPSGRTTPSPFLR